MASHKESNIYQEGDFFMKKKLIALFLVGVMVLSSFAACGETNAGGDPTPTEPSQTNDPAPAEKE